jgi:O-antigen/teichoic acid export membrane protein
MDRRQYLRHFLLLFTGTVAAQIVNLASYPALARLYTPVDFGGFAMFVAASAIPAAIACGRFDLVIPTAPKHGRFAILWLTYLVSAGVAVASGLIAAIYWLATATPGALPYALLLAAAVFLTGYCNATNLFLMRHDLYRVTSTSVVVRTAVTVAFQIGLAFVWRTPASLILGFCLGLAGQAGLLFLHQRRKIALRPPRPRHMRLMFQRYRRQVTVDIPSTFLAAISLNIMPFFLQALYGAASVGFFSLGQRIAILPLQLFNDSLSQVFFQKAARAQEERGSFWREMQFNLVVSAVLSVGVLVGIWLFAWPLVTIYLGQRWAPSAEILIVLAPMLALRSLTMSIATTVFVLRKAHWLFFHNIANTSVMCVAFGTAAATGAGLMRYLELSAVLMAVEYAVFALMLVIAVRQRAKPSIQAA